MTPKNLFIVVAGAVLASVAAVYLTKEMGITEGAWIGGAAGGIVSGILASKLAEKKSEE